MRGLELTDVQVVAHAGKYLGICQRCGCSLGLCPTLEALEEAQRKHDCLPHQHHDRGRKPPTHH